MKDRRLKPNGEVEEWERPATIPDDFIYDPEVDGYYPSGEGSKWDAAAWLREFNEEKKGYECGKLISADEFRAACARYASSSRRKSPTKSQPQRDLFSDLVDDDDEAEQEPAPSDPDSDDAAE